jgi:hypothetical protein
MWQPEWSLFGFQHVPAPAVTRHRNLCTGIHLDSRKTTPTPAFQACLLPPPLPSPSSYSILAIPPVPFPSSPQPRFTSAQLACTPWQCQRLSFGSPRQPSPAYRIVYSGFKLHCRRRRVWGCRLAFRSSSSSSRGDHKKIKRGNPA